MNDWPKVPLIELCDPDRGITYGIVKVGEFVPGGVPVVRGGDIRDNTIIFSDTKRVTKEVSNQFKRTIIKGGEVLINLISEPGHCAIAPDSLKGANVSRDVGVIALGNEINHQYIDYFLKSPSTIQWFEARLQGSVTQKINLGTLKEIPVPVPPRGIQDDIVAVLSALDSKIGLNKKISQTLEHVAWAVFKDWFVDFGPTSRKAAGETDPVAILGGLLPDPTKAAELAALFPDSFGDNGLPMAWDEQPLDQIAEFLNGLALQKHPEKPGEDSMPVIKIAELRNGVTSKSNRASRTVPEKYVLKDGDYIFSWSGSLMAKYWTEGEGALNQHLFKVTSETHPMWVVSNWVEHHLAEFQRIAAAKAVTMGHIKRSHLSEAMCVLPRPDDFGPMGEVIQPITDLMIQNELENQTLAATRDLLLPKLMSGEIRLKDAEGAA